VNAVISIDGFSGAGKSTLAAALKEKYNCNVVPMDHFFLRPFQRFPERLAEPGGNIDYERFNEEVIEPLRRGKPFAYRPYDCQTQQLSEPVAVLENPLTVIEGVYSLHPRFNGVCDLSVFLFTGEEEQRRRLKKRGAGLYRRFIGEWLPMERLYFDTFNIAESCDMVFKV
jgi:uridine kinase